MFTTYRTSVVLVGRHLERFAERLARHIHDVEEHGQPPDVARRNSPPLERASRARLTVYERPDRKWGWRVVSENGWVIAIDGGQGFATANEADSAARRVLYGDYADVETDRRRLSS